MLLPAAERGYEISLGFTNIGFVIAIIVIAFATILRQDNFAMKVALPRLIIIAILINFSQFFALEIVHLSNAIATGLITATGLNVTSIGGTLGGMLEGVSGGVFDPTVGLNFGNIPVISNVLEQLTGSVLSGLVAIIVLLLFGLMLFFAMVATAVMLFIRYIALNFLIILLPLALLMNVFPNLKIAGAGSLWQKWVEQFTKWIIFYPASMFFISLAVLTATPGAASGGFTPGVLTPPLGALGSVLIVAGLLIGGLMVSQKLGLAGAGTANQLGGWASRKLVNKGSGFIGNRLLKGTQLGAQMQQQQFGLAGAGAARASTAATGGLGLQTSPIIHGAAVREEQMGGMGSVVHRSADAEQPFVDVFGQHGGELGGGVAEEPTQMLEPRLNQPIPSPTGESETLPGWKNITPRSVRKATKGLRPSLRERVGANMVKYSFGGKSLGNIMYDAIPKNFGIFGEVASMEGSKKAEERLKKGQAVIEDLEKKTKKVEDAQKELDDLDARVLTITMSKAEHEDKGEKIQEELAKATTSGNNAEIQKHKAALERHGLRVKEIDKRLNALTGYINDEGRKIEGKIEAKQKSFNKAKKEAAGVDAKKAELKAAKGTLKQMTGGLNPNEPQGFKT